MLSKEELQIYYDKEEILVILISRLGFNTTNPDDVNLWITENKINWKKVYKILHVHGLRPFIYEILVLHRLSMPITFLDYMKKAASEMTIINLQLFHLCNNLIDDFKKESINIIPYKGPTLSILAFGNLNSRESSDLDFIISENDIAKVINYFERNNYIPKKTIPNKNSKFLRSLTKDIIYKTPFLISGKNISIEMHWKLTETFSGNFPAFSYFEKSIISSKFQGKKFDHLAQTQNLLAIISNHFVKDLFKKFKYLIDIALIIERKKNEIDFYEIMYVSEKYKFEKRLNFGLYFLDQLLGVKSNFYLQKDNFNKQLLFPIILKIPPVYTYLSNRLYLKLNIYFQDSFRKRIEFILKWFQYIFIRIYVDIYTQNTKPLEIVKFILKSPINLIGFSLKRNSNK